MGMILEGGLLKALKKQFEGDNGEKIKDLIANHMISPDSSFITERYYCNLCGFPMELDKSTGVYECTNCVQGMEIEGDNIFYRYDDDNEEEYWNYEYEP